MQSKLKPSRTMVPVVLLLALGLTVLLLAGCGQKSTPVQQAQAPLESEAATDTPLPSPSPSPLPTDTPEPTATPLPTDTPVPTETLVPTATPLPELITDEQGVEMILIPAGAFVMGSDDNQAAAKPAHTITLSDFYIDKYEVTNDLYRACAEAGVCITGGSSRIRNPVWVGHPVMDVTWFEAQRFCEWRGGRLPTEAEWEKAARGTDERLFPWGNDPVTCDKARYGACGWWTVKIGLHPEGVSFYGVHDMAGNVWEWTADWYAQDYYTWSPAENPSGPDQPTGYKSTRGGAWFYQAGLMTAVWRNHAPPTASYSYLGFRCARNP